MTLLAEIAADVRYAIRTLRRDAGFTIVALGVLAVGIGANTAIFSVINAVLWRPLPYPNPEQLTVIWETNAQQGVRREGPSGSNYHDWRERSRLFQDLAAVEIGSGTVTGLGEPQQVPALRVTSNLFSVFAARPALGRLFEAEDGRGGRKAFLILSHGFWQRALGGDPGIVGKSVLVDLIPYTVVGVLDRDFWFPFQSDLYVPWPDDELRSKGRLAHDLGVFGRMKPGVAAGQAAAELNAIHARLGAGHPEMAGWGVTVVPLRKVIVEHVRLALIVLFCAVGFVLLIACANVANLLLARAIARRREIAVRAAIGATRGRLIRQLLTESGLLAVASGALGVLFSIWGVTLLSAIVPATIPIPDAAAEVNVRGFGIDGRVLAFSLAVSMLTGILFGLAPALHALGTDPIESLKQGARAAAGGGRRMRETLLAAEVALALILLVGAGLMLKSFSRLQRSDFGFRADHLLTMELELPTDSRYKKPPEQSAFFSEVLERAAALPGVKSAALTAVLPLHPEDQRARFLIENGPALPPNERLQADLRRVSPSFFGTMGVALKRGRLLDRREGPRAPLTGLVDEAFAHRFFGDGDPVGRHLLFGWTKLEIVGVVGDVKHVGADRDVRPTLYASFVQVPADRMTLVLRTAGEPSALIGSAKKAIWSVDGDMPVYRVRSMEDVIAEAVSAPRLTLSLLAAFAAAALALASLGIFGVVSYTVGLRTREIGIRMALGANAAAVVRLVVGQGLATTAVGVVLGVAGALAMTRLIAGLLYGVSAYDPAILAGAAALLGLVSVAASWLPARRASRMDPQAVLKEE